MLLNRVMWYHLNIISIGEIMMNIEINEIFEPRRNRITRNKKRKFRGVVGLRRKLSEAADNGNWNLWDQLNRELEMSQGKKL